MPRAMVEIGHQLPDIALIAYPVISEKMKNEPWWPSFDTARFLLRRICEILVRAGALSRRSPTSPSKEEGVLILLRSILFNIAFYSNTVFWLIVALPTFFMPYRAIIRVAQMWGRTNLVLLRVIAGIGVESAGREKIPAGPLIVAGQASVGVGDLRVPDAVRQSAVHPQARA